jgi:CDP-alcohol phosphatidyltransferase-like enzyme
MAVETPRDQRLARWLVRPFARTRLRPNHITTPSLALGGVAGLLFARGEVRAAGWGAALFMLARFIDYADGELARLAGRTSRIGYYYDYVAGALSSVALFAGIGFGYAGRPLGGWALALGLAASVTALAGMGFGLAADARRGTGDGPYPQWGPFELERRRLPHRARHQARWPRRILRAGRAGVDRLLRLAPARALERPPAGVAPVAGRSVRARAHLSEGDDAR